MRESQTWLTEDEVIDLLGHERFRRLRSGRQPWLSPFYRVEGFEGQPMYRKDLVRLRAAEDLRHHPERGTVVAKGRGRGPRPVSGAVAKAMTRLERAFFKLTGVRP